jgi:bla regulator protein blaR1
MIRYLFLLAAGTLAAQTQPAQNFEVATVKVNRSGSGRGGFRPEPGRLTATNVSLKTIIQFAYAMKEFQIVGGPNWLDSEKYDLVAKAAQPVPRDKLMRMLQPLLAERFKLAVHRETKEMPVFALVVGKTGAKFREAPTGEIPALTIRPGAGTLQLKGVKASMSQLADTLTMIMGRTVLDRTGLRGDFSFSAEWANDPGQFGNPAGFIAPSETAAATPEVSGSSIFTAFQEQLGLKLEPQKGPVEVLVIDHVQRVPGAN